MRKPFVSIIVPFYNLEDSLRICVESLLDQTYDNYEVILVDDGSTDQTPSILDSYADNPTVHVHHKPNGGLSDARNYGVSKCHGEYISFVDGDDIVSPYYLEVLVQPIIDGRADFVVSRPKIIHTASNKHLDTSWEQTRDYQQLDRTEFIEKFLYDKITESAWGKLAPSHFYNDSFFPKGKLYEDLATIGTLVQQASHFACCNTQVYGYVMRPNSIVRKKECDITQARSYEDALLTVNEWVSAESSTWSTALIYRNALSKMRFYEVLIKINDNRSEVNRKMLESKQYVVKHRKALISDPEIATLQKIRICLFSIAPRISILLNNAHARLI